ncbi:MAG: hypothetical protein L3J96_00940 [Thermoplasmata archaeon]|nr:hypothetical protein [Thermoplasmata archaeon]
MTMAEYRTVLAVLAHPSATERQRIRWSGIPSSTYNTVRRRIFAEGWLAEVLVPNPGSCGFGSVEFLLVRPSISVRSDLAEHWQTDRECVLLWAGIHAVFGIFFRHAGPHPPPETGRTEGDENPFRVVVDRQGGTIPIYFDYSGLWARLGHQPRPPEYPRGIDPSSDSAGARSLSTARRMLDARVSASGKAGWGRRLVGSPRQESAVLEENIVQRRVVFDQAKIPPFDGRRIGEVIFIQGSLRGSRPAAKLLGLLMTQCGVDPFLVAEANGDVLIVGLGQTSARDSGRVPVASIVRPVMSVILEHLEPANVLIEPVEGIAELVSHRYHLDGAETGGGGGSARVS